MLKLLDSFERESKRHEAVCLIVNIYRCIRLEAMHGGSPNEIILITLTGVLQQFSCGILEYGLLTFGFTVILCHDICLLHVTRPIGCSKWIYEILI